MSNMYYSPEKFGLELVAEVSWNDDSYQFDDTIVLFHRETGRWFVESDSGCSCPCPFEGLSSLDDLAVFDKTSAQSELLSIFQCQVPNEDSYGREQIPRIKREVASALTKIGNHQ